MIDLPAPKQRYDARAAAYAADAAADATRATRMKLKRDAEAAMLHGAYTSLKAQRLEREAREIRRACEVPWGGVILAIVVVLVLS